MAIRTLPSQERYSNKNTGGGGTEPRRKLKKLRSVKVANLDRLRLSMRRERTWFDPGSPSESSSSAMSGTSSPNYMKATTSWVARKASSSSLTTPERRNSPASTGKSGSKLSNVSVVQMQCSDPAGANIPVDVKSGKNLKRVPSMNRSKKLSSMKSMKIRAKYSQFPDVGINELGSSGLRIAEFGDNADVSDDQDGMANVKTKQKGFLERSLSRSRSIRLTRLKSVRSSRRTKSRFGGGVTVPTTSATQTSNAEPEYMKDTSSQEATKHPVNGLTRTSSLRSLRILAKIPSLRTRRSKVRKQPQVAPLQGLGVDRATCSSVLKSSKFPDHIQLNSGGLESEGTSSFHVCPYNYCSLHSHHHHEPTPPLKEFMSAKRQSAKNQKGKQPESQSKEAVIHSWSFTETNQVGQIVEADSPALKEVTNGSTANYPKAEDSGMDFLIKVYAKPRKKWAIEGSPREDAGASNGSDHTWFRHYEWKLGDTIGDTTRSKARDEALNEGKLGFGIHDVELSDKTQQQTTIFAVPDSSVNFPDNSPKSSTIESDRAQGSLKDPSHISSKDSETGSGGDLINVLSDEQKYSSIWHLIYQQFVSSEEPIAGNQGIKSLSEDGDSEGAVMEKVDFDQTAAVKLVQEALDAILQRDGRSSDQQAIPDQEMPLSPGEEILIPALMSEENFRDIGEVATEKPSLESGYKMHKVEQEVEPLQQKADSDEGTRPVRNRSKSLSKLRKMIVTAKFIKAMEKLRKMSPGKPRYWSSEPTSEDERVCLMQPSMNEKRHVEEWMLDFALRKVISRLGPDEQRRVALLVKAFEMLSPDNRESSIKCYHVKGEADPGIELVTPKNEETKQPLESKQQLSISDELICKMQDDGVSLHHTGIPEDRNLREGQRHETCSTGGKILRGADETGILSESSENSTTSIDRAFEEPDMGNEVSLRTLKSPFRLPAEDSEVNPASDISTVLFDKNRYTSMWNMIYQHVISTEALMEGNNQGSDANTSQEMNDQDSTQSSYSTDLEEDEDNQSASHEKHESNESAAIKLVKEAVNAILQRYELSSDQQSIADQNKATDDVKGLYIPTPAYSTEERCRGDKRVTKPSEPEVLEKKNDTSSQQVEDHGPKEPHKKMSKSLSKLKRAIVTAKFIKAMERLRKINPQKTRHLFPEAATDEERVYLRHLGINGRKNSEEWMLDYALRQVISKLDPDQRKRVALLVEAFETVTPEQKENSAEYYPVKEEPATRIRLANPTNKELKQLIQSEQERSMFDEKVPQKQDDGFPLSYERIPAHRSLQKDNDHQVSRTDDKTKQNIDKRTVSNSTFERSKNDSISAYADVNVEELSTGDADTTTSKATSVSLRGDSKAAVAVDMTTILSDKQKYTSMWRLIYQHTVPSQASTARKQRHNEAADDEQDEDANNGEQMNYLDSIESTEHTNQTENENNQIEDGKEQELESAAIKLVKEAINAILQSHEMRSDEPSLQEHDTTVDGGGDLQNTAVSGSTEGNSIRWKTVGKHRNSELEDKLHTVVNENALVQKKVEANKANTSQRSSPRSFNKLRKVFITAKFMKAMERMRRISPCQPRYLSPEAASEEEGVNLRQQDINERRNAEEWMLDYALRKVISNLSPEQQRRVALLVEAFETVTPDQKGSGIRSYMKAQVSPDIDADSTANGKQTIEYEDNKCTPYDDHIWPNTGDIRKAAQQKRSPGEEHPTKISNFKTKLCEEVLDLDGNNLHSHHHASLKGCLVDDTSNTLTERKEIDPNSKSEPLQGVPLNIDSKQDHEADVTKGILPATQNHTSMWHLIYQHAKSVTAAETERSLSEIVAGKDDLKRGNSSSEMTVDADADDSDASSVTSELTESEAVKLVREAISDILSKPQELDNELLCGNVAAASDEDQTAWEGEKPEKTLSRGYSKLRKLIICNKFIKAMEKAKMRKFYPQKCRNRTLNADPETEKISLKPSTVAEKKSADEVLLDHALQKVIAGLAPVQQRRVALLVEAFEKVKPDTEEAGKRFSSNDTTYLSSAGNAKERKEPIFKSSESSNQLPDVFNFKLQELLTTSSREVVTDSALAEVHKEKTPIMSRDNRRNESPSSITGTTPDVKGTQSNDCKDPAEFNRGDTHHWPLQHEEVTSVDLNYSEPAAETAENPSEPEDLGEEGNPRMENDMAFDKVRQTNLWSLLVQHVKTDIFEETETQITGEGDANTKELHEVDKNDQYQLSSEVKYDDDTNVQMPKSVSFELQEKEAIKVVQEALDAILTCDDQSTTTSDTSDQDSSTENQGQMGEPSPVTKEIEGVKSLVDSVIKPKEEQRSEENLSSSCNKLSQVILCKRFIKAMDKMRKLKPQDHSQQLLSEEKIVRRIHQNASNQGKNWEEWMLDHAMQQVVGNLAPAQKKKVSLLVQAFEKIGSQPAPGPGQKGKATGF